MARHTEVLATVEHRTEVRATADLHTEAQAETLHIEAQAAAVLLIEVLEVDLHTEVREAHHTEAQEVHLTEAQEAALHTEVREAAADEALAEAHEAEEAEDKFRTR